jgi:hypothetical protein
VVGGRAGGKLFGAYVGGMRMEGLGLCPKCEPETPIRGGNVKVEGLGLDLDLNPKRI